MMNKDELYNKRKRRKKIMNSMKLGHIFIIGVIYKSFDEDKIEAFKVYDIHTKETEIQSVETIRNRLENGEKILGVYINHSLKYNSKTDEYILMPRLVFNRGAYDIRKTDILNGKGEVVTCRKSVIIGVKESESQDDYIVMNGNGEVGYITEEEAIKNELIGVINSRYICLNSCQDVEV